MTTTPKNTTDLIEARANALAAQVLTGEYLASFIALPLHSKLAGLAFFAHIARDTRMANVCLGLMSELNG